MSERTNAPNNASLLRSLSTGLAKRVSHGLREFQQSLRSNWRNNWRVGRLRFFSPSLCIKWCRFCECKHPKSQRIRSISTFDLRVYGYNYINIISEIMLYACLPNLMQMGSILAKAGRCALTLPLLRRDLRTQPERESEGGGDSWPVGPVGRIPV